MAIDVVQSAPKEDELSTISGLIPPPPPTEPAQPMAIDVDPLLPLVDAIPEAVAAPAVEAIPAPAVEEVEEEDEEEVADVVSFEAEWYGGIEAPSTGSLSTSQKASLRQVKLIRFDPAQGNTWVEIKEEGGSIAGVEDGMWGLDGVGQGVAKRRKWAV